jgi:hypothetical protein
MEVFVSDTFFYVTTTATEKVLITYFCVSCAFFRNFAPEFLIINYVVNFTFCNFSD